MLTVNEIFHSIQGESTYAGEPCVFVRLTACDLRCSWCDTPYAFHEGSKMSIDEVIAEVEGYGCPMVEVTGGEPLLQQDVYPLMSQPARARQDGAARDRRPSQHRSGAAPASSRSWTSSARAPAKRSRWTGATCSGVARSDQVKFVIKDRADYEYARDIVRREGLADRVAAVLFSPVHGVMDARELADWILADAPAGAAAAAGAQVHLVARDAGRLMPRAVVLLSGGLDSYTAAAVAARDGFELFALTIEYGQRHARELEAARRWPKRLGVARHVEIALDLSAFGGSALTAGLEVPKDRPLDATDIPITYVPARNTIFLSLALAWAEVLGAEDIVIGVNALDYSGYPDCRPEFIRAFEPWPAGDARGRRRSTAPGAHAAAGADQGRHHPARHVARARLRPDPQLLRSRA